VSGEMKEREKKKKMAGKKDFFGGKEKLKLINI